MGLAKMRNVLAPEQKIRNGWIHGPKRYHQDLMFPFPHLHFLALLSSELALPLGQPSLRGGTQPLWALSYPSRWKVFSLPVAPAKVPGFTDLTDLNHELIPDGCTPSYPRGWNMLIGPKSCSLPWSMR